MQCSKCGGWFRNAYEHECPGYTAHSLAEELRKQAKDDRLWPTEQVLMVTAAKLLTEPPK